VTAPQPRNPFKTPSDCPYCPPQQGQNTPPGGIEGDRSMLAPPPGAVPLDATHALDAEPTPEVERRALWSRAAEIVETYGNTQEAAAGLRVIAKHAAGTAGAARAPLDGDHDVAASPQVQPRQPTPEVERLRAQVAAVEALRALHTGSHQCPHALHRDGTPLSTVFYADEPCPVRAALAAHPTKGDGDD
jgi:hypothetical protein